MHKDKGEKKEKRGSDKKILVLVCNAHLDPVWLWPWEEGAAEVLSTFRTAAELCEDFGGFVFCHNEALLYQWVQEYDPPLFTRIQKLVKEKKWHIMGGWYLQPDCNMPSGESIVRQISAGRRYFQKVFGVRPETAVNFDSFGHSRGLVQILKKSGYSSYLFYRPDSSFCSLPSEDFEWIGFAGSKIAAHRAPDHYNSQRGKAAEKAKNWISNNREKEIGILLWGVGNHGGGPSREDLAMLDSLIQATKDRLIVHGTPERYFAARKASRKRLPGFDRSLNPWAVGCYTSMSRIKAAHRRLESEYYQAEKIAVHAFLEAGEPYPAGPLEEALADLLFCEFHDILPGSAVPEVETQAIKRINHGLEILSRIRTHCFFSLLAGQARAAEDEFPIFVYNSHPYPIQEPITVEFQPTESFPLGSRRKIPILTDEDGHELPSQWEKGSSNLPMSWRKRVVFTVSLLPSRMHRYSCRLREEKRAFSREKKKKGDFVFRSDVAEFGVDPKSGWLFLYRVMGKDYLERNGIRALVMEDSADSWGMQIRAFRKLIGEFQMAAPKESARLSGISRKVLPALRIIEDGPVRTVVEALFGFGGSSLCIKYMFPKKGSEIEMKLRVFWQEKDRMLKLALRTPFVKGTCLCENVYGAEEYPSMEEERVGQRWTAVISGDQSQALSVINRETYGFDFWRGELRLSLLRSPAYAAAPSEKYVPLVPQDRFTPRIDQGERIFHFWFNAGPMQERTARISREAQVKNEMPPALCFFSGGGGRIPKSGISLSDEVVQVPAIKISEEGSRLIIRLFEPTGTRRSTTLFIPPLDLSYAVDMEGFEIKTLAVDLQTRKIRETDLLEQ